MGGTGIKGRRRGTDIRLNGMGWEVTERYIQEEI